MVEAADLPSRQHGLQPRQDGRQVFVDARKLGQGLVCLRHADAELELGLVGFGIKPFQAGKAALFGDQVGLNRDAIEERGHVDVLARDVFVWQRRLDFADDFLGHFFDHGNFFDHIPHHVPSDDAFLRAARRGDDVLDAFFDLASQGGERQQQCGQEGEQKHQADD